jgi:hypothetical protein
MRDRVSRYNSTVTDLTGLQATEALDLAISEHEQMVENLVSAVAKTGDSPALLDKLAASETKLAELRSKRETIAAAVRTAPVDSNAIINARSRIPSVLREGDAAQMRTLLAAFFSEVRCDWSKRKNAPMRVSVPPPDDLPASMRIDMLGPDPVPLILESKFSTERAERSAEDAMRKVVEALA